MRVMILINNDVGLYQFRKELIEDLLIENEVIISLPDGDLVKPLVELGCLYVNTKVDRRGINPFTDFKLFFNYQLMIKEYHPDIVISYTIKPNIYGGIACRLANVPYAINITGLGTAFENGGILKKIVTLMYKVACKKSKVVFFENEANRKVFISEDIVKAYQTYRLNGAGVNLEKYTIKPYPIDTKINFLFMGRVMAEKGIDELFSAMEMLVESGIDCELSVLGGYEEDYANKIEKYTNAGWLTYYGYQKNVIPFIESAHCFVLPSWHEGMANTNLESAASGRPIITTRIPGCMEAVVDGKTGFLVNKKDTVDLFRAMKEFASLSYDQRVEMGLAGRKHMEEHFDKKMVIQETTTRLGI